LFNLHFQVTLIPGDGIGAEITDSVKEIFEHVNAPIEWEQYDVSGISSSGEDLFKQAMESLKRNRVGLKGKSSNFPCSFSLQRRHLGRHSLHSDFSNWAYIMERRYATTARHLCFCCSM
jgi:isocitrate/isopropylmalate dehydrogenase